MATTATKTKAPAKTSRYNELRKMLENRRRELVTEVQGRIRDVRAEGSTISTSRFVPQQTEQITRPSAGQLRFSFRVWQRGHATTQALHTTAGRAIVAKFLAVTCR